MDSLDASLSDTDAAAVSINDNVNWFTKPGIDDSNEYVGLITYLVAR